MPNKDSKKKKKQDKNKSAPAANQPKPQEPQAAPKDTKKRWFINAFLYGKHIIFFILTNF